MTVRTYPSRVGFAWEGLHGQKLAVMCYTLSRFLKNKGSVVKTFIDDPSYHPLISPFLSPGDTKLVGEWH